MQKLAKKVLLIGWDAADWKIINPLIDAGLMPALESMINEGVMGNLSTLEPPFSPMLWTSIATGKRPDKHGILGFSEPTPDNHAVRPVSSLSRKVKAIWNILTQKGYKTHVVGWWPSHPAEPINGIMVSNLYQQAHDSIDKKWDMMKGTVHPAELSDLFAWLRVHPAEITDAHIQPFVNDFEKIDQDKDKRLESLAKLLAETASIQAATTCILENEQWDFTAVYFDGIDHFCHGFMNFHPPKMSNVPTEMYELYKDVVNSAYRFHDLMLAELLRLAGEDTTVILVSDHGFHSDHLRPQHIPDEPAGPAFQHRPYGIVCMKGNGIKKDERIHGASLLDVTPTLLTLFGLPIGEDMDGKPLVQAFENPIELEKIDSWENVDEPCGMHSKDLREDPYEAQEAIRQLVELGYIEAPNENIKITVERTIDEAQYNLGRVYVGSNRYKEALPIFEKLYQKNTDDFRFLSRYIECLKELGNFKEVLLLIQQFRTYEKTQSLDKKRIKEVRQEKMPENLTEEQQEQWQKKHSKKQKRITQAKLNLWYLDMLEADILMLQNKPKKALELYQKVENEAPKKNKQIFNKIGDAYLQLRYWKKAQTAFEVALEHDIDSHQAHGGLAICCLNQKKYEQAIDEALTSVSLIYHNPRIHYCLGEALFESGEYEHAAQALKVCLSMNTTMGAARNRLIEIYEHHLSLPEQAEELKQFFRQIESLPKEIRANSDFEHFTHQTQGQELINPIFVVSGLPRSGTSMMMQMLAAGGMNIFSDQQREADENNPKGYYEHQAVKGLMYDKKWLQDTQNQVVKIVSHLLLHLPMRFNYKIIFMQRNLKEVVASQQKMLVRDGKAKSEKVYRLDIENALRKNLEKVDTWLEHKANIDILFVNYAEVLENPLIESQRIAAFLRQDLDLEKMTQCVSNELYRTKL